MAPSMLKSIVIGCHWLFLFPGTMLDQGAQVGLVSALTITNVAMLASSLRPAREVTVPGLLDLENCLRVWQAANVSIALWLVCLVTIRAGAQ